MDVRIGTAGWTIPAAVRERFPGEGTHLERYARVFSSVEINSSFYRPHRASTYTRWASSVPDSFRFSLKVPKAITHERRLVDCEDQLAAFLDETSVLGVKRDVLLVQLPPKLAFDEAAMEPFFTIFRRQYAGRVACEPRHPTWFTPAADTFLALAGVARVAADPTISGGVSAPGGSRAFHYMRLHGSPRIYYSSYEADALAAIAATVRTRAVPTWCIFDNTALGAGAANALAIRDALEYG